MAKKQQVNCFQVRRLGEKRYKIVWVYPGGEEVDAEQGHIYPHRQNAYRRCKELNDTNTRPYTIYVQLKADRKDCYRIANKIREMVSIGSVAVYDPIYPRLPDERVIQFSRHVRHKEEDRDPNLDVFDSEEARGPVASDFYTWLGTVRKFPGVRELESSTHSFFYPPVGDPEFSTNEPWKIIQP